MGNAMKKKKPRNRNPMANAVKRIRPKIVPGKRRDNILNNSFTDNMGGNEVALQNVRHPGWDYAEEDMELFND